jgi:hypothetical protein
MAKAAEDGAVVVIFATENLRAIRKPQKIDEVGQTRTISSCNHFFASLDLAPATDDESESTGLSNLRQKSKYMKFPIRNILTLVASIMISLFHLNIKPF